VETNETFLQAAKRELFEETGLQSADLIGQAVWKHEVSFQMPDGEYVLAEEHFFLIRIANPSISCENRTFAEKKLITEHRWWPVVELQSTKEIFFPENLADIIQNVAR
jgi:8-oxo-dGTP diphosphatase